MWRIFMDQLSCKQSFKEAWLVYDWTLLMETCLEWEEYLKSDGMERSGVARLEKKHCIIMCVIKKIARRTKSWA